MRTLSMAILCIMLGVACKQDDGSADYSTGMKAHKSKDYKEALKWLTKAADKGHIDALNNLGVMYLEGREEDVPQDDKKAFRYFLRAAREGHVGALNNLAVMYDNETYDNDTDSTGVEKNFRKADRLWLLAAQQGDTTAMENFWRKSMLMSSKDEIMYWKLARNEIDNWKSKQLSESGSGFYITKEYILTNAHVVCSDFLDRGEPSPLCGPYKPHDEVRTPYYRLKIVKTDTDVDLALLKVVSSRVDSSSANIRSGFELELGEDIAVFGYPLAEELSFEGNFTIGNISAREGRPTDFTPSNFFQFTAPIQRGNSGGPVLDAAGNVVGITKEFLRSIDSTRLYNVAQNINFAISLKAIKNFLKDAGVDPYSSSKASSEKDWIVWEWKEALKKLANHPNKRIINDLKIKIRSLENINKLEDERFEESPNITGISSYWREHIETIKNTIRQLKKETNGELDSPYLPSPKKWTDIARAAEEFTVPILCFTNKE